MSLANSRRRWRRSLGALQSASWNQADEQLARLLNLATEDALISPILKDLRASTAYEEFNPESWLEGRPRADVLGSGKVSLNLSLNEREQMAQLLALSEYAVKVSDDKTSGLLGIGTTIYTGRSPKYQARITSAVVQVVVPFWRFVNDELRSQEDQESSNSADNRTSIRSSVQNRGFQEAGALPREQGVTKPLQVFLCHASDDKKQVRTLHSRLLEDGFYPWLDEVDILPGQEWEREIAAAVRSSDVVVVCLSRTAIGKEGYLQKELRFALDVANEKPLGAVFLIPARLEECEPPEDLDRWQRADLFREGGYAKLKGALETRAKSLARRAPRNSAQ